MCNGLFQFKYSVKAKFTVERNDFISHKLLLVAMTTRSGVFYYIIYIIMHIYIKWNYILSWLILSQLNLDAKHSRGSTATVTASVKTSMVIQHVPRHMASLSYLSLTWKNTNGRGNYTNRSSPLFHCFFI